MGSNDITLASTTDTLEQVNSALGIAPAAAPTEAPPVAPAKAAPAPPGAISATTQAPPKGAKATPAPAPAAAAPAPAAPVETPPAAAPAEPPAPPVAETTTTDDDDDALDDDDDGEVDPARSAAAAELGRRGGIRRGKQQQRIHKLVAKTHSQAAEIEALRRVIDGLPPALAAGGRTAASPAAPAAGQEDAPPAARPMPLPEQYETYEQYAEELAGWKAEQVVGPAVQKALAEERQRAAQQAMQQRQQAAVQAYQAQMVEAATKYDDFDEVVQNPALNPTHTISAAILDSKNGAEIAYYLGKNVELCQQIIALGDSPQAARMMGRVEATVERQLEEAAAAAKGKKATLGNPEVAAPAAPAAPAAAAPAPAPRPVPTRAPDPITPVGSGTVAAQKSPDQMTFNEYKQWRAAGGGR